jgi:hypothetical protein
MNFMDKIKKWGNEPYKPMHRGKPETNSHNLYSDLFVCGIILFFGIMFLVSFSLIPRYVLAGICMVGVPNGYHFISYSVASDAISGTAIIGTKSTCTWANDNNIITVNVAFDPVMQKYIFYKGDSMGGST